MILRLLILAIGLAMPLAAAQEGTRGIASRDLILLNQHETFSKTQFQEDYLAGCDICRGGMSGAELLQMVKRILNEGLFA